VNPREILDPRVRRALFFALDRRALTELGYGGRVTPQGEAISIFAENEPLYEYAPALLKDSANDPARAAQWFAEAGLRPGPDGMLINAAGVKPAAIEVRASSARVPVGTAIADMWKRAGFDSKVDPIPQARVADREYLQAYPGVEITGTGQGDRAFARIDGNTWATARNGFSGSNRGHYSNPRFTELAGLYRASLDEASRGNIVREMAGIFKEELPFLPIFFLPVYATVASGIRALDDIDGGHPGGGGYYGGYPRTAHLWEKD
jgi:peptide/nickel transport system substrate-binding protein